MDQKKTRRGQHTTQELIDELNRRCANRSWFVCFQCNRLRLGRGNDCWQSKSGDEQYVYCDDCTVPCKDCGNRYPPDDYRYHYKQYWCGENTDK